MTHSLFKKGELHYVEVGPMRFQVHPGFLDDIVSCAFEGGIGHWSSAVEYKWDHQPDGHTYGIVLDNNEHHEESLLIDTEVILKAINLLLSLDPKGLDDRYCYVGMQEMVLEAVLGKDSGLIDAGLADDLVQLGLFGSRTYS